MIIYKYSLNSLGCEKIKIKESPEYVLEDDICTYVGTDLDFFDVRKSSLNVVYKTGSKYIMLSESKDMADLMLKKVDFDISSGISKLKGDLNVLRDRRKFFSSMRKLVRENGSI